MPVGINTVTWGYSEICGNAVINIPREKWTGNFVVDRSIVYWQGCFTRVTAYYFIFLLKVSIDPVYIKHCNCRDQKDNIREVVAVAVDSEGASTECKFEVKIEGNRHKIKTQQINCTSTFY